ncbi:DUF4244 domain-containing protein [Flexivirga sp. ID2601S]|uniref:DUF4244 domain-containing protein n=1 Tax=Flexivirga aerilata TaxID=1656889 RepID=A0A849ABX2_9MICO|nr:DUF4244 domain-containing protein [Flexivirga aerilata]NNG38025.1 DUF4244 domain-containing protein [Flexivirga aerilata]
MTTRTIRLGSRLQRRWLEVIAAAHRGREAGMTTAEYAVGTLAAVAFAAVLMAVVKSGAVKSALTGIIQSALSVAS